MNTNATAQSDASVEDRIQGILFDEPPADDDQAPKTPEGEPEVATDDQDDKEKARAVEDDENADPGTLAEYLGVSEDQITETDDGQVFINVKVDGETTQVPMQEVIKSYQLQKHVNNKSMVLSEQLKTVQAEREMIRTEAENRFYVLDKMAEAAEQQLLTQYNQVDWARLRAENPAEYVAMQRDFEQANLRMQQARQVTLQQKQQFEQQEEAMFQQEQVKRLAQQAELVLQNNPTWADEKVRTKEVREFREFMSATYGYSDEELNYVTDHRQIQVIKDAMAFRKGQALAEEKVKKPVPKFQKAGRPAAAMAQMRDVKARRGALKATGSVDSAAALLVDRM